MNKIIQKEQEKVVNGVNVTKLSGIVSAIQESPEDRKIQFPCQRKMDKRWTQPNNHK